MIKKVTNQLGLLLGAFLILALAAAALFPIKAQAAFEPEYEDEVYDYEFGETYQGYISNEDDEDYGCGTKYFKWSLEKKSNVSISFTIYCGEIGDLSVYDDDNKEVIPFNKFACKNNNNNETFTYTYTGVLPAGVYYQRIHNNSAETEYMYEYFATAEPAIVLKKPQISSIKNENSRTMTVSYTAVKNRMGYQVEYSTNSKFKNASRSNTGATTRSIGKLTKGNIYYVRVRAYALYGTGNLTYSSWSTTSKIKIKK